jgi:hypothetical protein
MRKINSVEKIEDDDQEGSDPGHPEVLTRLHVLECHQMIMRKINSVEKKEDYDQEGADPGQPEVLGSPARVRKSSDDHVNPTLLIRRKAMTTLY